MVILVTVCVEVFEALDFCFEQARMFPLENLLNLGTLINSDF